MAHRFEHRTALVTGAASGIGLGIASRLAAEGARVLLTDVNAPTLELARQRVAQSAALRADVTVAADCEAAVAEVMNTWGRLDALVNCAGIGVGAPLPDLPEADWDRVLDVNLKGAYLMSRAAWCALGATSGAIVNIASMAGLVARPGMAAYGASKAGLIQLTRVLAVEGAPQGLRANALCPVWVDTPMFHGYLERTGHPARMLKLATAGIPLGRIATVDDVAAAAAFIASDEARFITGVALPIDGGAGSV